MISPSVLNQVAEQVALNADLVRLRGIFPDLHFSECFANDVTTRIKPALELDSHELYLITGRSGHCLEFTSDMEGATGILVAEKSEDD